MGTMQRNKRLKRELAGRAPVKVLVQPIRALARAFREFGRVMASTSFRLRTLEHIAPRDDHGTRT